MNNFSEKLKKIKLALFDLDGTLYIGDDVLANVGNALDIFRSNGIRIVYLTNNSSKTAEEYESKLKRLGLWKNGDAVYSSLTATADYILSDCPDKSVYLFGTRRAKEYFAERGIKLQDRADVAVMAYNTELTYKDICQLNANLYYGARYIATNPDIVCPAKDVFLPDNGSIMEIFHKTVNRLPEIVIGKPYTLMGDMVKLKYNLDADEIMMVGDRLYTDIKFGVDCGFLTALVLCGETKISRTEKDKGYYVFDDVYAISRFFK
ncbi:MAG: HAD-IIA family hydrolase [Christensenellaceae bacterium]